MLHIKFRGGNYIFDPTMILQEVQVHPVIRQWVRLDLSFSYMLTNYMGT